VADAFSLPAGFGFRAIPRAELALRSDALLPAPMDALLVFEPPRSRPRARHFRYILGVDVGDGLGQDRSVCSVTRVGTIEEPAEEVAQYITDSVPPSQFAFLVDAIGHLYTDDEGREACAAIECNNHGLSVQDTLQLHLGYTHFYTWEYYDAKDPARRRSTKIGWVTTPRTRPLLLDKFYAALTTLDPVTGKPDYILNSPWTIGELADFQTETYLGEAEAAAGAHDDCILSNAIANYVAWRQAGGEQEPLGERRRRRHEEAAARVADAALRSKARDYRNTAITADEMSAGIGLALEDDEYEFDG
jgi:hypothetical protein